jgi:hypothetical protein
VSVVSFRPTCATDNAVRRKNFQNPCQKYAKFLRQGIGHCVFGYAVGFELGSEVGYVGFPGLGPEPCVVAHHFEHFLLRRGFETLRMQELCYIY